MDVSPLDSSMTPAESTIQPSQPAATKPIAASIDYSELRANIAIPSHANRIAAILFLAGIVVLILDQTVRSKLALGLPASLGSIITFGLWIGAIVYVNQPRKRDLTYVY